MKREIKFRGFNKKNNKWLYGDLIHNRGLTFVCPVGIADPFETWKDFVVETESVGQFTGLHDCNGKEIYEGDIVTIGNNLKAVVIWFNGSFRFKDELSCKATYFDDIGVIMRDFDVCIIGNIHDNPELLKQQRQRTFRDEEIELLETVENPIDWEQRRYEIAKDVLVNIPADYPISSEAKISIAVMRADALIKELKRGEE